MYAKHMEVVFSKIVFGKVQNHIIEHLSGIVKGVQNKMTHTNFSQHFSPLHIMRGPELTGCDVARRYKKII
jgi:hypothetical protein